MPDPAAGTVIVRYIDELETALLYAQKKMQPMLANAAAAVLEKKRLVLGWAGEVPGNFDEAMWLAPEEWRMPGDADENDFYLFFALERTPCIDGHEPKTWVATMAGFAGATVRLMFKSDKLDQRGWKSLLRTEATLLDALVNEGFLCDPKSGHLALTVSINRESLADGFEDEELEGALAPLAEAVDRLHAAQPVLNGLVDAIKAKAQTQ